MNYSPFKVVYELSSNPTKLNLQNLHDFIIDYPSEHLKNNYPLFLNCILSEIRKLSPLSEDCIAELLVLLQLLPDVANSKILLIIFEEISNFIQNFIRKKAKNQSESFEYINVHLAVNIIKLFNVILMKAEDDKYDTVIYSSSGLLLLGYIVSFILYFIEYYKERNVQSEALLTLAYITSCKSSNLIEKSNVVVNFAPGIFKSLMHVIQSDSKVGSMIKSKALTCFGCLIVLIYGDKSFRESHNKLNVENHSELMEIIVERNTSWKKDTWEKVSSMIKLVKYSIISRLEEESWKVRLALTKISIHILEECSCVGPSAVDLIDCLIAFNGDSNTTVRATSTNGFKKIAAMSFSIPIFLDEAAKVSSSISHSGVLLLSSVVRDNLENVIDSLKVLVSTLTDDGKCNLLQILNGYLQICENQNLNFFDCTHLKNILTHLITICALDYKHVDLLEGVRPLDFDTSLAYIVDCEFINKQFIHFHSSKVYNLIKSIIGSVVRIVQPTLILSILFSLNDDNSESQAQVILLSQLIISSLCRIDSVSTNEKVSICKTLLTRYFDPDILNIPTCDESYNEIATNFWKTSVGAIEFKSKSCNTIVQRADSLTPSTLKQNTLILSLVMELCAACSVCLSPKGIIADDTESWMMRTCLFEVMNKVQQRPYILNHSACQTLYILSLIHDRYDRSLSSLVRLNGDYIMDSVTRKLRANSFSLKRITSDKFLLSRLDGTCRCLITLCQHSDIELLPFMSVILDQLLYCLDITNGYGQYTFVVVLQEMIKAIRRWSESSLTLTVLNISDNVKELQNSPVSNTSIVRSFLLDRNEILISSGIRKSAETDEATLSSEEINNNDHEAKPASSTLQIITKVMDRCVHISSSSSAKLRLTCLRIINDIVFLLQNDKDVLSKVVHKLWSALEHRFCDKEFTVILAAFDVLNTISQLCGGFLLIKIRTSLVSKLCTVLDNCAKISISPSSSMKYTGLYKLQISLIRFLSFLSVRVGLEESILEDVVDVFILYLDDRHPRDLIEACHSSMIQLLNYNPGLIWFKISQILPTSNHCHVYGHMPRIYNEHFYVDSEKLLEFIHK